MITMKQLTLIVVFSFATITFASSQNQPEHLNETSHTSSWTQSFDVARDQSVKLETNKDVFTSEQMERAERFFYNEITDLTVGELGLGLLEAKIHASTYSDLFIHRYDSFNDLKHSGGPRVNQELCLKQLQDLNTRVELHNEKKYSSRDINLLKLLDTFGRMPPGLYMGKSYWLGVYSSCLKTKIDTSEGLTSTRYCVASARHTNWPKGTLLSELAVIKVAVCLPESCDSLNYKNKYQLVQALGESVQPDFDKNQSEVINLYCLPDEQSSLRAWWLSPRSAIAVTAISAWIMFVLYSTYKSRVHPMNETEVEAKFGLSNGFETKHAEDYNMRIYQSLSIFNNLSSLFDTTKTSSLMETGSKMESMNKTTPNENPLPLSVVEAQKKVIVDLRILEGIKVIAMCYVIIGHVLMCLSIVLTNGREMTTTSSPVFLMANMVPAFAVNTFFTITGLLTSYLLFKQNQTHSFMTSPIKWVAFIFYRYLRIMPMYMLVVLYAKHIAKYTSSGPIWDYGTTTLGQRRTCEQESWLWTILFAANFKPPLDHCIPSAWYLANDFQFFMVTPIFLTILYKNPEFGKRFLKACIVLGYVAGFLSILLSDAHDLKPVAKFMVHGFKTYITFLSSNYTRPQYRIPAYLCGIFIGYTLHEFEQKKRHYLIEKAKQESIDAKSNNGEPKKLEEPNWSEAFIKHGVSLSIFFVVLCCVTPLIGARIPFNKLGAKLMVSFIMPTYHILFSLSVGLYILLATTGYGSRLLNNFLSASMWKPFARLSLCAVLINVEVIIYIIQSSTQLSRLDTQFHLSLNILSILATYLCSVIMCVLFEAPIRAALNHLLAYMVAKSANKQKTS